MSLPLVVSVGSESPAALAGVAVGDVVCAINGEQPRDVIRYQLLVDEAHLELEIDRGGIRRTVEVVKADGAPLGIEVQSAIFDQVRTCDNHCGFCFIYQLPPGMRKSLYLKDDDYRLSFLYGNFTTLTRFTEADFERVVTEGLSPLYVSIHATDREKRTEMLRNRRGATSLRWLSALLDAGVEVHGQVVVCPGMNDGDVLADTLLTVLDHYPELASIAVVPLGISDHSNEPEMRAHSVAEARAVVDLVEEWQETYRSILGRRLVFAADEYYLLAQLPFPPSESYEGFAMHEDGIGMARSFEREFMGQSDSAVGPASGFFAWVDGAPAEGYRSPRTEAPVVLRPSSKAPVAIVTGSYGARVLAPLVDDVERDVRILAVENRFFGGNIGVAGLMVGEDVARTLSDQPEGHRYLLPDVCLQADRFLDGMTVDDLPRPVEIVATDGVSLRKALGLDRQSGVGGAVAGSPEAAFEQEVVRG